MAFSPTPTFPIITWPVAVAGTLNVGSASIGVEACTIVAATDEFAVQFGAGIPPACATGSVIRRLADAILTHTIVTAVTPTYGVLTSSALGLVVPWSIAVTLSGSSATPIALTQVTAGLFARLGITGTTLTATGSGTSWTFTGTAEHEGYFAPYQLTTYDDRDYLSRTASAEAVEGAAVQVVTWGDTKCNRRLEYPFVNAASVYLYRRVDANFASPVGYQTTDPNNLYENLITAARASLLLRVWSGPAEYRDARLIDKSALESVSSALTDVSGRGRLFQIAFVLRDLGGTGP